MKPAHLPRSLLIGLFLLISVTFLTGSLHAFVDVRAVAAITPTHTAGTPTPAVGLTGTPLPASIPADLSNDTSGILAMAGVILAVILFGALVGLQKPRNLPKRG